MSDMKDDSRAVRSPVLLVLIEGILGRMMREGQTVRQASEMQEPNPTVSTSTSSRSHPHNLILTTASSCRTVRTNKMTDTIPKPTRAQQQSVRPQQSSWPIQTAEAISRSQSAASSTERDGVRDETKRVHINVY